MKCPICKGSGELKTPNCKNPAIKIELNPKYIATQLRKKGYSFREIAKLMGFKNPQSVKFLIEK